ncbi:hypothetical protein AAZV13_02G078600 [Glycine max]
MASSCLLLVKCSLANISFSSSFWDCFLAFFFYFSTIIFLIFLVMLMLSRRRSLLVIDLANLFCFHLSMASTSTSRVSFKVFSKATFIAFRLVLLKFCCLVTTEPLTIKVCLDSSSILLNT